MMKTVHHHPRPETLTDFAAGRLDEARAVVVATHAAQCETCARAIAAFEAAGGALLETVEPVDMRPNALERVLARADETANVVIPERPAGDLPERSAPLARYLTGSMDDVKWKPVAIGVWQADLDAGPGPGALSLLKIAPRTKMLEHTHDGEELALVLRGGFRDGFGEFGVGDLADLDHTHTHQPVAIGDEPCICLIASTGRLRFTTLFGKLAQRFIGV